MYSRVSTYTTVFRVDPVHRQANNIPKIGILLVRWNLWGRKRSGSEEKRLSWWCMLRVGSCRSPSRRWKGIIKAKTRTRALTWISRGDHHIRLRRKSRARCRRSKDHRKYYFLPREFSACPKPDRATINPANSDRILTSFPTQTAGVPVFSSV